PERLEQLHRLRDRAYVPYSGFPVAALILSERGQWFGGCNVETAHYKSVCAEASAISAMVGAGEREIRSIHILGPDGTACAPCGDCRQRLREFGGDRVRVRLVSNTGRTLGDTSIAELLPDAFGPDDLD
ncbi:MAG: cytidine deaminase, partial [Wenzhouxiangella sp.]|nr:cytidine deaminase [Wenzhouxiangella sp.]